MCFFFFFNDTATTEIYTLSLHDALPISLRTAQTEHAVEPDRLRDPAREVPHPLAPRRMLGPPGLWNVCSGRRAGAVGLEGVRERGDGRVPVHVGHRDPCEAQVLPQLGDHPRRKERVAAQVAEEIVAAGDGM